MLAADPFHRRVTYFVDNNWIHNPRMILSYLGPALGRPFISQKELRAMTKLPPRKQKEKVRKLLAAKGLYPFDLR
jgi:hypothetical protein